jgi:Domain of unknown function (DUF4249)
MLKYSRNPLLVLMLALILITCVDPFNPHLKGTGSILVVDALLTNENRSYRVELSRTTPSQNIPAEKVSGANIYIRDRNGNSHYLNETAPGVYKTDSLTFIGQTGNTYVLDIVTTDGIEYESDPCIMYPVEPIDNVYFTRDQSFSSNGADLDDGIRIFLDSENDGGSRYLRWDYKEWWKFSVPYPKEYTYIDQFNIPEVDTLKQVCWTSAVSDGIDIRSAESSQSARIEKEPILFIASGKSDRLLLQYCIEVRQLSLSQSEFEFWDHMKQINESTGDIFEKQPFSIISNIHNKNNPGEPVLGYFQVSSAATKRIYITPDQLEGLNIPEYKYDCESVEVGLSDYFPGAQDTLRSTFDKIYEGYTLSGYIFIKPVYDMRMNLIKMVFSKPVCALCTARGSLKKPDFWVDLKPAQKKR